MNRVHEVLADLQAWLRAPGLPLKQLARELEVAPNTLFKVRRGEARLQVDTLERLEGERLRRLGRVPRPKATDR